MTLLCPESRPVDQQSSMLTVKPLFLHWCIHEHLVLHIWNFNPFAKLYYKANWLTVTNWYFFKFMSTTYSNCLFDVIKWEDRPMHVDLYGII